jgi:hypothetical protein
VFKVVSAFLRDEPGRFVAEVEAIKQECPRHTDEL